MNPPSTARLTDAEALRGAFSSTSDEDIVERLRHGETQLFEVLMRRHNQRLFRVARSIVKDGDEAEDVIQDAYVQAFTKLEQFQGRAKFCTWLTRIAVHEALARVRARRRPVVDPYQEPLQCAMPSPEDAASNQELVRVLEPLIDALPDVFRTVFVLRAVEGLDAAECAECLDIPEETVRTRYFRARRLLQRAVDQQLTAAGNIYHFHLVRCDRVVAATLLRIARSG